MRPGRTVLLALLLFGLGQAAVAEEESPDDKAKALYEKYLLERKDPSWWAFQRRLSALRGLGPIQSPRARESLLRVARTGKTLDDRLLAARGLAVYGDLASVQELIACVTKRGHPVLTQVIGEGLAHSKVGEVVAWLSEDALAMPTASLAPVLRAHALLPTPEAAAKLAAAYPKWASDPATIDLAFDALQALGRGTAPDAAPLLVEASGHADVRLRLAAADVLARPQGEDPAIAQAVKALLHDPQGVVKRAMAEGIEAAECEAYVPDVTFLLEDDDPRTRKAAHDALKRMTKKDFGFDAGAWRRWWEKRDTPDAPEPYTVPSYYGLPVFTERVVFILDRSGSMRWPYRTGVIRRMEVAQSALGRILEELSPTTRFNVLAFDDKVRTWKKSEQAAEPKTVANAVKWVMKQESKKDQGTNTHGVLQKTYEDNPTIDTIFFLSDGIPQDGDVTTSEGLLAAIQGWNRYRRVKIHVIALTLMRLDLGRYPVTDTMRRAEAFMRDLARVGGGSFMHVTKPPAGN